MATATVNDGGWYGSIDGPRLAKLMLHFYRFFYFYFLFFIFLLFLIPLFFWGDALELVTVAEVCMCIFWLYYFFFRYGEGS